MRIAARVVEEEMNTGTFPTVEPSLLYIKFAMVPNEVPTRNILTFKKNPTERSLSPIGGN